MPVIVPSLLRAKDSSVPSAEPAPTGVVGVIDALPPYWVTFDRSMATVPQLALAVDTVAGVGVSPLAAVKSTFTGAVSTEVAPSLTSTSHLLGAVLVNT